MIAVDSSWRAVATEGMSPRERMLAAFRHEPVDRVPTDIWATPEIWEKLERQFGPREQIYAALHIDGMDSVSPRYAGPKLPMVPEDEIVNFWGMRSRRVDYGSGAYHEQYFYPLAQAETIDDLQHYPWPRADWFDFSSMRDEAIAARRRRVMQCGYMAPFFYHNLLRGLETSLLDPIEKPDFTEYLLRRICDFFYAYHRRMFEACAGQIDVAQVTDDLGTQTGPMIGLETFRRFYKPHLKRFIDLCHEFGILVMHHDDGAIRAFLPDLVDMRIDILNPIQWRCPGMDLEGLKRDFGDAVCFHGAIDNQQTLPHGSPEDVRAEVRYAIDVLAADDTGYVLAPCHCIQPVTPLENIIAMYDESYRYSPRRWARGGRREGQ